MIICTPTRSVPRPPRGFLVIDAIIGIIIALLLLMALTVSVIRQQQAERRMALTRAATRELEAAMFSLQGGTPIQDESVVVERLNDAAPPGRMWVRLTLRRPASTTTQGASATEPASEPAPIPAAAQVTLIGLVPAGPATTGGAP